MLLLGRWFSLLGFAVLSYFAMKKLPFGKSTLFLLAILPMNLQQCTSFSYDAVITGVSFLFISWCLSLTFGEKQLKGTDMLGLGILGIILVYGKSGVYLPLALLIFLIPAKRFGGKRIRNICAAGLFLLPVLCFLNQNTGTVTYDCHDDGGHGYRRLLYDFGLYHWLFPVPAPGACADACQYTQR